MVDFIKNWQQPISLCGVEITSSKRNQALGLKGSFKGTFVDPLKDPLKEPL